MTETNVGISTERLTKSDSISSKDQSIKSDSKQSKELSTYAKDQLTKSERTAGTEKQSETGTDEKKKLRWL